MLGSGAELMAKEGNHSVFMAWGELVKDKRSHDVWAMPNSLARQWLFMIASLRFIGLGHRH